MTATKEQVIESLLLDQVDHQELHQTLLWYFGQSESSGTAYKYTKKDTDLFLIIEVGDESKVKGILDHNLDQKKLNALIGFIKDELIENQNDAIGQRVCFSHVGIKGYFKFRDLFQLIPVPNNAPKPCARRARMDGTRSVAVSN